MKPEISWLLVALVILLPILWQGARGQLKGIGSLKTLRRTADDCLRGTKRMTPAGELYFDGASVKVLSTEEQMTAHTALFKPSISSYGRTYIVRDRAGDYFMFIYRSDNAPYLKRVADEVARVKLGDRYIAPPPRFRGPHDEA